MRKRFLDIVVLNISNRLMVCWFFSHLSLSIIFLDAAHYGILEATILYLNLYVYRAHYLLCSQLQNNKGGGGLPHALP